VRTSRSPEPVGPRPLRGCAAFPPATEGGCTRAVWRIRRRLGKDAGALMQDCPASWLLRPFKTAGHWANTRAFLYVLYLPFPLRATCEIWHAKSAGFAVAASCVEPAPSPNAPPPIPSPPPFRFPPCGIASGRTGFLDRWFFVLARVVCRTVVDNSTTDDGAAKRSIELAR